MKSRQVQAQRLQLGKRLATIRGERSQRGFARDLGVFQQNMNRYENQGNGPHVDFLIHLAQREGVSLDWLLLGVGKPRRAKPRKAKRAAG